MRPNNYLFFILAIILFSPPITAQKKSLVSDSLILKVKSHLKKMNSGTYLLEDKFKAFSKDSIADVIKGAVSFCKAKNTSTFYKYKIEEKDFTSYLLGDSVILVNHKAQNYKTLVEQEDVTDAYFSRLIFPPFTEKFWETQPDFYDSIWVEETQGNKQLLLHFYKESHKVLNGLHLIVELSSVNYIPVKYTFSVNLENMIQIEEKKVIQLEYFSDYEKDVTSELNDYLETYKFLDQYEERSNQDQSIQIGAKLANTLLPSSCGDSFDIAKIKPKLILLDFWYRGCLPCLKSSAVMNKLQIKYKNQGLLVLGVNTIDAIDKIHAYEAYKKLNYCSVQSISFSRDYKVTDYPTFVFLDSDGKVIKVEYGYSEKMFEQFSQYIEKVILN